MKTTRFFYGWVIVAVGVLVSAFAFGIRNSFAVMFPAILAQYGWPRDTAVIMYSFQLLAYGVTAPVAGLLLDRFGVRKTMGGGVILLAIGTALCSTGHTLWQYYLFYGALAGIGLCLAGTVPFTRIIANWFSQRLGLALALLFFGGGGSFALYPVVAFLIEKVGWQRTFLVEAGTVLGLLFPLIIFLVRFHPREKGLEPDGIKRVKVNLAAVPERVETAIDKVWTGTSWTMSRAMRTRRFWLVCLASFANWGVAEQLLVAHQVAFAEDAGYPNLYASSVLGLFGIFIAIGSLAGFISDRIGREVTFTIANLLGISGVIMLMLVRDTSQPWLLYGYTVAFGLSWGMSATVLAVAATDLFRGPRCGTVIGSVWTAFAVGGTIGPWLGGYIFESAGSYIPAFILAAIMFAAAAVFLWIAAPRKVRLGAGQARIKARKVKATI